MKRFIIEDSKIVYQGEEKQDDDNYEDRLVDKIQPEIDDIIDLLVNAGVYHGITWCLGFSSRRDERYIVFNLCESEYGAQKLIVELLHEIMILHLQLHPSSLLADITFIVTE